MHTAMACTGAQRCEAAGCRKLLRGPVELTRMRDVTGDWGQTGKEVLGAKLRSDDFTWKP